MKKGTAFALLPISVAFALCILLSCRSAVAGTPEGEAPGKTAVTATAPRIAFQETDHDFGAVGPNRTVKHTFTFMNKGDDILRIHDIKATCGCTGTLLSKETIPPGEQGDIEVTFRPGASGGQRKKAILVHSNDPAQPTARLYVSANVIVPAEVRPRLLYWVAEKEQASLRTVQLIYRPELDLHITDIDVTSPAFSVSAIPMQSGESPGYEIVIKYDGSLPVGAFQEKVSIKTDNSEFAVFDVGIRGKVSGPIKVIPESLALGVIGDDNFPTRMVRVFSSGQKEFEVSNIKPSSDIISAEITKEQDSRYVISVTLKEKPAVGAFSEKLIVELNDSSESPLEIPVYAYVR